MRRTVRTLLVSLLSLLILCTGMIAIRINYQNDLGRWDFASIQQYQQARRKPTEEIIRLTREIKTLEASVQGSVVLIFDQCTANLYDHVFLHMSEYEMAGSVIFRQMLPGDEGAITKEQWQEMKEVGWTSIVASDGDLVATLSQQGYPERLSAYLEQTKRRFDEKGMEIPNCYELSQGEYCEENLNVLMEHGFTVFISDEAETALVGENAVVFKEFYISSDPKAPLLQKTVEAIKNMAQVLVIKTRYVDYIEDITKDIRLDKFRWGMLRSLSTYRVLESLRIEPADTAFANYKSELFKLAQVEEQRLALIEEKERYNDELDRLWQYYRG